MKSIFHFSHIFVTISRGVKDVFFLLLRLICNEYYEGIAAAIPIIRKIREKERETIIQE
ncbi:MAG: hypothetical protein QXV17_03385 [Candidatus Micrarchaeaceae archaeon]